MSLLYEYRKLFSNKKVVLLFSCFILIFLFCAIDLNSGKFSRQSDNERYQRYMEKLSGAYTEEKESFIKKIQSDFDSINEQKEALLNQLDTGQIHSEQYLNEESRLYELTRSRPVLDQIQAELNYVKQEPKSRYFLNDRAWNSLLCDMNPDFVLILFTIVISVLTFSKEFSEKMYELLMTGKRSRKLVILNKYIVSLSVCLVTVLVMFASKVLWYQITTGLDGSQYPLQSLTLYQDSQFSLNLGEALMIVCLLKCFAVILMIALTGCITVWIKNTVLSCVGIMAVTILPFVLFSDSSLLFLITFISGMMIGEGYLGAKSPYMENNMFVNITPQIFTIVLIIAAIVLIALVLITVIRFNRCRIKKRFRLKPVLLLIVCCISFYCFRQRADYPTETYNSYGGFLEDESNIYYISEDQRCTAISKANGKERSVIRNPFYGDSAMVTNIFVNKDGLYYLLEDGDTKKIIKIDQNGSEELIYVLREEEQPFGLVGLGRQAKKIEPGNHGVISFIILDDLLYLSESNVGLSVINLTDGRKTGIEDGDASCLAYYNQTLYFIDGTNQICYYNLNDQTVKRTQLLADMIWVSDGYIYYNDMANKQSLTRYQIETSKTEVLLSQAVNEIKVDQNTVYYLNQDANEIWMENLSTKKTEKLYEGEIVFYHVMDGEVLWFLDHDGKLERIQL